MLPLLPHENSRCAFVVRPRSGRPATASGAGRGSRNETDRGGSRLRGGPRHRQSLGAGLRARWHPSSESPPPRTAPSAAPGGASSGHHGADDREPLPRSIAPALRPVDARSGAALAGPALQSAGLGLDGGPLSARLGPDAAEAGATGL